MITSALTLSACSEAPPPKQNPDPVATSEWSTIGAQSSQPEPVPEPSEPAAAPGTECFIEYTWLHDVPRGGGAHHVQLRWVQAGGDEQAHWQVEDSWTRHGSSQSQIIRRTISDQQALRAFDAGVAAIKEFNFATASRSLAYDVPSVTLFVGSKEATEIRCQNWYAMSQDVSARIKSMLQELQSEVR